MQHPVDIGDRTTLAVMLVLRELGFGVLVPVGENVRYDLVMDDGQSGLLRCLLPRDWRGVPDADRRLTDA